MKKEFKDLFNDKNAKLAAESIVDSFDNVNDEAGNKVLDYDFQWSHGEFISEDVNTFFKFDTEQGSLLNEMLLALCDPNVEPTEDHIEIFDKFRDRVKYYLENDYKSIFLKKIRDQVLNLPANVVPLQDMKVVEFELADKPENDSIVVVEKNASMNFNPGSFSRQILEEMEKTGETPMAVVNRKIKENGGENNPDNMWAYINNAYKRKYLYEVQLDLYVDYSLAKVPPIQLANT